MIPTNRRPNCLHQNRLLRDHPSWIRPRYLKLPPRLCFSVSPYAELFGAQYYYVCSGALCFDAITKNKSLMKLLRRLSACETLNIGRIYMKFVSHASDNQPDRCSSDRNNGFNGLRETFYSDWNGDTMFDKLNYLATGYNDRFIKVASEWNGSCPVVRSPERYASHCRIPLIREKFELFHHSTSLYRVRALKCL